MGKSEKMRPIPIVPENRPPFIATPGDMIGDRRQPLTPTLSPLLRRGAREKIGPAMRAV
jgi:hypothetical protein